MNPLDLSSAMAFATGLPKAKPPVAGFAANTRMYVDMSSDEYHSDKEVLSCSALKPILISPAHFQTHLLTIGTSSKVKDFGTLVHALVLEPALVGNEVAVFPGVYDGRSDEYKAFAAANVARLVVDEPTFASGRALAEKVLHRMVFGRPFGDYIAEGEPEVSIFFEEQVTGVALKIRPDLKHPEFTFDLKTTRHSTLGAFIRDAVSLDYDLQAFMYSYGRALFEGTDKPKPFVFIGAESSEPHSVHVVRAGDSFLGNGAQKFQEALTVYKACMSSGLFPDASGEGTAEISYWDSFKPETKWKDTMAALAAA